MSLLKKSQLIVNRYQNKYQVKFENSFPEDFLRSIYSFKGYPLSQSSNIKKEILYYSVLNMFNYNFWPKYNINYSRSKELNKILLKHIYPYIDDLITDRKLFLNKLKNVLLSENFKMINWYINDIDKMFIINYTNFKKDLFKIELILGQLKFVKNTTEEFQKIYNKIYKKYYKFLNKYFGSYGNDIFQKRELLAWNLITESIGLDINKLKGNEAKCFIPIDYRIPSILKYSNVLKLPVNFNKYFQDKEMLSKEDELVLRSFTFLTLQKLKKELQKYNFEMADLQLDNKLFNMYSEYIKMGSNITHFKFNTTAY